MSWNWHEQIDGIDIAYTDALWVHPHEFGRKYPDEITNAWSRPQIALTRKSIRELAKRDMSGPEIIKFLYDRIHRAECLDTQVCKERDRQHDPRFVPPYRMKKGFVYFMYCEAKALMKIGCSVEPKKRQSPNAMDIGAPVEIVNIYEAEGMYELENEFHEVFSRRRSHGEWFKIGLKQLKIADWYMGRRNEA